MHPTMTSRPEPGPSAKPLRSCSCHSHECTKEPPALGRVKMGLCQEENRPDPKEVSRRLARGWKICWMRKDQENWGCPAQGEGDRRETRGLPGVRAAEQSCHRPSFLSCLCLGTGSPCKLSSRLISKPTAELHSRAEETERLRQGPHRSALEPAVMVLGGTG